MAILLRFQFFVVLLVYLLASRASMASRNDRRSTHRHRKTATPTYPHIRLESSTTALILMTTPEADWYSTTQVTDERPELGASVISTNESISHGLKVKDGTSEGQIIISVKNDFDTPTSKPSTAVDNLKSGRTSSRITTSGAIRHREVEATDLSHQKRVPKKNQRMRTPGSTRPSTTAIYFSTTSATTATTSAITTTTTTTTTPTTTTTTSTTTTTPTTTTTSTTTAAQTTTSTTTTTVPTTTSTTATTTTPPTSGVTLPAAGQYWSTSGHRVMVLDTGVCNTSCELVHCEPVEAELCRGRVVKDRCGCCPVCLTEPARTSDPREDTVTWKQSPLQKNACERMNCAKNKVCILNIQGIPMCRCPNIYSCRSHERNLLCAQNGVTYKNKCFLKAEECTNGKRIRVLHRGPCLPPNTATADRTEPPSRSTTAAFRFPRHQVHARTELHSGNYGNTRRKMARNVPDGWRNHAENEKTKAVKRRPRRRSRHRE